MQLHHLFIHNFSHFLSNVFNMLLQRRIVSRCQVIIQKSYKPILDIQYIQTRNYISKLYTIWSLLNHWLYTVHQSTSRSFKKFPIFSVLPSPGAADFCRSCGFHGFLICLGKKLSRRRIAGLILGLIPSAQLGMAPGGRWVFFECFLCLFCTGPH